MFCFFSIQNYYYYFFDILFINSIDKMFKIFLLFNFKFKFETM